MRGILAAAGAASLAAMSTLTAPNVMLTANVLTVTGYTALGTLDFDMDEMFQGAYCSEASGNTCTPVNYLSGLPIGGEADGLRALTSAIRTAQSPTTVLAFSQGATISSEWLRDNAGEAGAPSPEDLSFVLVANPLRKYGGVRHVYDIDETTPDTEYSVLDIAIEYDGAADFPDDLFNLLAVANAIAGFQYIHLEEYDDIDLENAEKLVWQDGNTSYVLIRSQNIPLLEPLRILGLHELANSLNDPLKAIIDSAYNRDYPGLVDPESHDDVLQQFSAQDSAQDEADTPIFASLVSERSEQSGETTDGEVPQSDSETIVESDTAVVDDLPAEVDGDTAENDSDFSTIDLEDNPTSDSELDSSDEDAQAETAEPDETEVRDDEADEAEKSRDDARASDDRESAGSTGVSSDAGGSDSGSEKSAE